MDERAEFVKQWFYRAEESLDDFEAYIFLWLAFIVTLKAWAGNNNVNPSKEDDGHDGWYVMRFFSNRDNFEKTQKIFSENASPSLCKRKSIEGDYIVASCSSDQKYLFELYQFHTKSRHVLDTERYSTAIGVLLKAVRNNLFHGGKLYDSKEDQKLMAECTPILRAFVIELASKQLHLSLLENDE